MASPEVTVVTSLAEAASAGDATTDDEVVDALLLAARELMQSFGIRRLRMDDVAKRAGYGRATLYRRFATRDELVWGVVTKEVRATLAEIEAAITDLPTMQERLVEAFAATVEAVRQHPLLQRLLDIEPDLMMPHLTTGGADGLQMARSHLKKLLARGQAEGELGPIDLEVTADMLVRLAHSLLLSPGGPIPVDDPKGLRAFARAHIAGPLLRLNAPSSTATHSG